MPDKPDLKVVQLRPLTHAEMNPDDVLRGALGELKEVVVVGTAEDGTIWLSCSYGPVSLAKTNLMLDLGKRELMRQLLEEE